MIQELTATPELNKTYLGKVQRITDFGAFVEIMAGTDGLLHVSEIANHRVKDVRDELKEGEQVLVKVINIDPTGKIRLSRKALLNEADGGAKPAEAGAPAPAAGGAGPIARASPVRASLGGAGLSPGAGEGRWPSSGNSPRFRAILRQRRRVTAGHPPQASYG